MQNYTSPEAVSFINKALKHGLVENFEGNTYRPTKDGLIMPNGDIYDIGSRFQVLDVTTIAAVNIVKDIAAGLVSSVEEAVANSSSIYLDAVKAKIEELAAPTEVATVEEVKAELAKAPRGRKAVK